MTKMSLAFMAILLAAPALRALPALPQAVPAQGERCERPAAGTPLPSLRIETCPTCELDPAEILAWQHAYADAARAAGYGVDFLATSRVRITETGLLPNGTPYAIGEAAGMRFRVGDPHPGATLGTALGRMTFVILSGEGKSAQGEGLR